MIKNDKNDKTTKLEKKHGKNDINCSMSFLCNTMYRFNFMNVTN